MRTRWTLLLCLTLCVWLSATAAQGQTVPNPTTVIFTASADHNLVIEGFALLTSYRLDFYQPGATAPFQPGRDLGKPVPDATGTITLVMPELFAIPIGPYVAKVVAVGPAGETASEFSSPFVVLRAPTAPGIPSWRR